MITPSVRTAACIVLFLSVSMLALSPNTARSTSPDALLRQDLTNLLQGGSGTGAIPPSHPLYALRKYPLTATTAYLLMEDDPALLAQLYPQISKVVMQLFAEDNLTSDGLVRGVPGVEREGKAILSPGFNALADLELYSLHLIAWKAGAYEDALELLESSNKLSDEIVRSFYDPSRQLFFPIDENGLFVAACSPSQLLPLVADTTLGSVAHERIAGAFVERSAGLFAPKSQLDAEDPWRDPFMRPVILDILFSALEREGESFSALRPLLDRAAGPESGGHATWSAFWKEDPSLHKHLFPRWRAISSAVNLTLLFQRESLIQTKELAGLRAGIDSLVAAISAQSMGYDSYAAALGTVNGLQARFSRISTLIDSRKERWRILDEARWLRLSPRIKRLVTDGCMHSIVELDRARSELSRALERDSGIAFRLALPARPVVPGNGVDYAATLEAHRDTLAVSQCYIHVGSDRRRMTETNESVKIVPGGSPLRYEDKMFLPSSVEPGIVTLPVSLDFMSGGRRVELHDVESIVVAREYDAALYLPEGRKIQEKPVPIDILITYRPDHEVEGEVGGSFLREFTSTPALPAGFTVAKDSGHTKLTLTVSPKGMLSPGRYPFSLNVSLDGKPIALLEENLIRPFRWLHLGPFPKSDEALNHGLTYQSDLLKTYATSDGRTLRWHEVPSMAIDGDGALWPRNLYGATSDECMLLYTVVDAPARMKLTWRIATKNPVSVWINSAPVVMGTQERSTDLSGSIELRKGTNSFLIATCWAEDPGHILFDLGDENGLPAAGLNNELDAIVDGYERLGETQLAEKKEAPPQEQLHEVTLTYSGSEASEVCVIGSFNNWEPGATQMKKWGKGPWTANIFLRPGRYTYKFLVNRKSKVVDPSSKETEADGFGGVNSVLVVH